MKKPGSTPKMASAAEFLPPEDSIRYRLNQALAEARMTVSDAHRMFVALGSTLDRSALNKMLLGTREVKAEEASLWAKVLDLNVGWLIDGIHPKKSFVSAAELVRATLAEGEHLPMAHENDGYSEGNYRPRIAGAIPEIDVRVGAGEGAVGDIVNIAIGDEAYSGHAVLGEWMAPEKYIRHELNISTKQSIVMEVVGDSMQPTFLPGDRVIVDLRVRAMTQDGVYIISDGASPPQIKRLTRVLFSSPVEVEIVSDNPAHRVQRAMLEQVHIIGRVAGRVTRQ